MPRNNYPEETIKKILDVSLKLFLEKGFEQTTVLDIVENLGGLTRGAFYHHFKSKNEVLETIFQRDFIDCHPFLKNKETNAANGLERIKLALKCSLLSNIESEQHNAITNLAVSLLSNPRFLSEQIKSNQEVAKLFAPIIEEGMADGSIAPGNPKVIADLFMMLANFWMFPNIFPCEKEEFHAKASILKKVFESIGCPIIDAEMEEIFFRAFDSIKWG